MFRRFPVERRRLEAIAITIKAEHLLNVSKKSTFHNKNHGSEIKVQRSPRNLLKWDYLHFAEGDVRFSISGERRVLKMHYFN